MKIRKIVTLIFVLMFSSIVSAADWSKTEAQITHGNLSVPSFAGGGKEKTTILTFQHASDWKYGDNFFFVDISDSESENGFNDKDIYGEWYSNFSLGKITGKKIEFASIKDIGFLIGLNFGADANVLKYLPGVSLSWDVPGFSFVTTKFMYYIEGNEGVDSGGAPKADNGFMFDVSWNRPFQISNSKFSFEGHVEYLTGRKNELGDKFSHWILAQPQFRWYMQKNLAIGIEYQFWMNKLGDQKTNENVIQALFVYQF